MVLYFEPIQIATPDATEAVLVFSRDKVVAVLSHLSEAHGELAGHWFVECAFGEPAEGRTFASFDDFRTALVHPS